MQYTYLSKTVAAGDAVITQLTDFSLEKTLFCGQCFRFEKTGPHSFYGVANNKALSLEQPEPAVLIIRDVREQDISSVVTYLDLETDYSPILSAFCADPVLAQAVQAGRGMRILRQDPFESLISFIFSQNNNIKRIAGIIGRFCESFGRKLPDGSFAFPSLADLGGVGEKELAPLRAGFRAGYVSDALYKLRDGQISLNTVAQMPYGEAKAELMKIKGVGPKVADCVLLFGFYRLEAVPVDVWIRRALNALYGGCLPGCVGAYAGVAQQLLFDYVRRNPHILENISASN